MNITLVDGIQNLVFHNGVVRIDCVAVGPNGEARPSGTLLIPGNVAGSVLESMIKALQELERKLRDQQNQNAQVVQPN